MDVKNDGSSIEFKIPGSVSPPPGEYQIAYVSPMITRSVQKSNYLGDSASPACSAPTLPTPSTAACFSISSTGGGSFNLQSVGNSPPANAPPDVSKWLLRDSRNVSINSAQILGIGIEGQQLSGIQILIDGQPQPIKDIANNYPLDTTQLKQ